MLTERLNFEKASPQVRMSGSRLTQLEAAGRVFLSTKKAYEVSKRATSNHSEALKAASCLDVDHNDEEEVEVPYSIPTLTPTPNPTPTPTPFPLTPTPTLTLNSHP